MLLTTPNMEGANWFAGGYHIVDISKEQPNEAGKVRRVLCGVYLSFPTEGDISLVKCQRCLDEYKRIKKEYIRW